MKKRSKLFKIAITVISLVALIAILMYFLPIIKNLVTPEGRIEFKNKINELGFLGVLLLFALQLIQIFLIIIPGEPIEILAGMCYGTVGGLLFITISSAIITTLIMLLVRMLGRKFVYEFFSEEKIKKIENSKMFKNPKRVEWIMIILFLIPGTPKDLIVYIAALLPIDPFRFIAISTIARMPSIISSTLAGSTLANGKWGATIMIYVITFAIIGVAIFLINKFDKSKATEDVLESMK